MHTNLKKWLRFLPVCVLFAVPLNVLQAQDADKIAHKYIRSVAGIWSRRHLDNVVMKLDVTVNGMQFKAEVFHKNENLYKQVLFFKGDTVQEQIYNKGRTYISNFSQKDMLNANQAEAFRHQAWLYPELAFEQEGYTLEYEGTEKLNRIRAHKVRVTSPQQYTFHLWYRKSNGMRVRSRYPVGEPGAEAYLISDIMKYREIKGIAFPVYKRLITGNAVIVMKMREVLFPDLSDKLFAIPD